MQKNGIWVTGSMCSTTYCQHGEADGVAGLTVAVDGVEVVASVVPFGFIKINDASARVYSQDIQSTLLSEI